jgi:hypothetical protein
MSDSSEAGCLSIAIIIITVAISIGSGMIAWNWIEPEGFWGAIVFLIAWGVLSKIGHLIAMGIAALFFS